MSEEEPREEAVDVYRVDASVRVSVPRYATQDHAALVKAALYRFGKHADYYEDEFGVGVDLTTESDTALLEVEPEGDLVRPAVCTAGGGDCDCDHVEVSDEDEGLCTCGHDVERHVAPTFDRAWPAIAAASRDLERLIAEAAEWFDAPGTTLQPLVDALQAYDEAVMESLSEFDLLDPRVRSVR